jgi:hypothetical protein
MQYGVMLKTALVAGLLHRLSLLCMYVYLEIRQPLYAAFVVYWSIVKASSSWAWVWVSAYSRERSLSTVEFTYS